MKARSDRNRLSRRRWLAVVAASSFAPAARAAVDGRLLDELRAGGRVLLLRHARTDPGVGDPPGFVPGRCETQRNLDAAGRADAAALGRWLAAQRVPVGPVLSSAWCRCLDTARLAFGRVEPWPPLDSMFDRSAVATRLRALAAMRARLATVRTAHNEVWVTHGANVSAFVGESPGMGDIVVVDAEGRVRGRLAVDDVRAR